LPAGANALGLARVGVVPQAGGLDVGRLLAEPLPALLTYHAGSQDTSSSAAYDAARSGAEFHVYIGAYACNGVKRTAHAVLPVGLPPEIDGTYINVDGIVQTMAAGAKLPGDARAGWRVLRALGALMGLPGFDFTEVDELRAQMKGALASTQVATVSANPTLTPTPLPGGEGLIPGEGPRTLVRVSTVPVYRSDAVVRRAPALQAHPLTGTAAVGLHPEDALALGLANGAQATISGAGAETQLPVIVSRAVPRGAAWVESTWSETRALPPTGAALTVARA
jgi:NADH-quinone oxidoreductase subunit G